MNDWVFMVIGYTAMIVSEKFSDNPASVWNPVIDLGSFAVGGSLIITQPENTWARRVGMLQVGVHLGQLWQASRKI